MQMSAEERLNKLKILTLNMENKKNELEQMKIQCSLLILGCDTNENSVNHDVNSTGESIDESENLSSSNFVYENHAPQAESTPFIHAPTYKKLVKRKNGQDQLKVNVRVSHSRHDNNGNGTNENFNESENLSSSNFVYENHAPQAESTLSIHAPTYKKLVKRKNGPIHAPTYKKLVKRKNGQDQLKVNVRVFHSRHDNNGNGTNESVYESRTLPSSNLVFEHHAPQAQSTSFNHAPKQRKTEVDVTQVKAENSTKGQDQLEVNDRVPHQLEGNDRESHQLEVKDLVSHSHHNNSEISTDERFDESNSINENRQAESSSSINVRNRLERVESSSPINLRNRLKRLSRHIISKKSPRKIIIKKENESAKNERRKQSMEWKTGEFCWIQLTRKSKWIPGFHLPESNGIAFARSITLKGTVSLSKFLYHQVQPNIAEKLKDIRYKHAVHKFKESNGKDL